MDNYNEFGVNNNDEFFEENNYKNDKKNKFKNFFKQNKNKLIKLLIVMLFCIVAIKFTVYIVDGNKAISKINTLINEKNYNEAYKSANEDMKKYKYLGFSKRILKCQSDIEQESEYAYQEGISILSASKDDDYSDALEYFNNYISIYSFSKNKSEALKIVNLINEFDEKNSKLQSEKKLLNYFDDNEKILNILKKYYTEINNFHSVINEGINGKNSQKLVEAYSLWHNNKDYYYNMFDDVKNAKKQVNITIFSNEDFENFFDFLTQGLAPGEYIYNLITFNSRNSNAEEAIRQSWSAYEMYQEKVDDMISNKTIYLSSYKSNLKSLEDDVNKLKTSISNYSNSNILDEASGEESSGV